ncbi:MAG: magnesium transporter CorA family protein [Chloroflexi bacterium]|nr:magnesium transporter CorA family protein [Chloroflexota bacterium]
MTESRFYHISKTGKIVRLATVEEALALMQDNGFLWLDYIHPSKEELSGLTETLGLHPLSIEDCFDDNQIPKIEDYPKHTFILFNAFHYTNQTLTIYEVDLFIGSKFLVTVSREDPDSRPTLKEIERMVEFDIESARQGPAFLAHVFLDYIVDKKFSAIEGLEEELDTAEDLILANHAAFNPAELLRLRRELLNLRKSLFHEREILVKICRKDCLFISEKAILLYRDIYDHLAKFFELTESSRDIVTSLMEMYLSMINNQMTRAANDTNVTVRRLTFITTIFMPLTLLAGIGGMSEFSMMTGTQNWRIAYPLFLLAMVVIGILTFYFLVSLEKKRKENE